MQIFHPVFGWWLGSNYLHPEYLHSQKNYLKKTNLEKMRSILTSDQANVARAISKSLIASVGFLLKMLMKQK